ncbi:hypothetical protein, partial [Planktothrix sp.]|uniref:hypothetical protein n=1 Tax=Planktothrix sp. TaxID=3088171 RepID=UPI0038D44639
KTSSEPSIQLSQSPNQFHVKIPSGFSLQYISPVQKILGYPLNGIKKGLQILPGTMPIKILGLSAMAFLTTYPLYRILEPSILSQVNFSLTILFYLTLLGIPVSLGWLIYKALIDYKSFEQVKLNFQDKKFEIFWFSYLPFRKQGEISQIQQINL